MLDTKANREVRVSPKGIVVVEDRVGKKVRHARIYRDGRQRKSSRIPTEGGACRSQAGHVAPVPTASLDEDQERGWRASLLLGATSETRRRG